MSFARVRLLDCFDGNHAELWADNIKNDLDGLLVCDGDDAEIYCLGRWPEGLTLRTPSVVMDRVDELPDDVEEECDLADASEALTSLYYDRLRTCPGPLFDVVRAYASTISPKVSPFVALFGLGRHLKALDETASPRSHKQAVQLFCLLQHRQFAHCWDLYEEKYGRITTSADSEAAFDSVVELARATPIPCDDRSDLYRDTVAVAYQLSRLRESREFYFPPSRFKAAFDMDPYLLSRFKKYMQEEGFIRLVDPHYQFGPAAKKAKCQLWKWVGPEAHEAPREAA